MAINRLNPDYPDAGLVQLVPTSVAVGSGSSTVNGNGLVSFSGSSSVSLNGIFTSTYTVYRILVNVTTVTTSSYLAIRLRANGSDNTSAVYSNYSHYGRSGNANAVLTANENDTIASMIDNISNATSDSIDIFNPNLAVETIGHFQGAHWSNSVGYRVMSHWGGFRHGSTYQADGCTFVFSGTTTGNIRIYGYKE